VADRRNGGAGRKRILLSDNTPAVFSRDVAISGQKGRERATDYGDTELAGSVFQMDHGSGRPPKAVPTFSGLSRKRGPSGCLGLRLGVEIQRGREGSPDGDVRWRRPAPSRVRLSRQDPVDGGLR